MDVSRWRSTWRCQKEPNSLRHWESLRHRHVDLSPLTAHVDRQYAHKQKIRRLIFHYMVCLLPFWFMYCTVACNNLVSAPFLLQVKIWFQNKRSKFKKIIKQGRGTLDSTTQTGEQGLPTTTQPTTSVWNSYLTSYADSTEPAMVSYVSEYNSWYQTVHQEDTQHTQLLWTLSEVAAHFFLTHRDSRI